MIQALIGTKGKQTQVFDEKRMRLPTTVIHVGPCTVVSIKRQDSDKYWAVQLGLGVQKEKNVAKPERGYFKKTGLTTMPRFLREIRLSQITDLENLPKPGEALAIDQIFSSGDMVSVTGTSKGKGFAGGVKRHHFAGGPATHGQSDRERAPGSIGSTTTPGRVYKGKRMAGRMGGNTVTVKGLRVVKVDPTLHQLVIAGLIPGSTGGLLIVRRTASGEKTVAPAPSKQPPELVKEQTS